MSIRIIKEKEDCEQQFITKCKHCCTEFVCSKTDGYSVIEGGFIYVNCPKCSRECIATYFNTNIRL